MKELQKEELIKVDGGWFDIVVVSGILAHIVAKELIKVLKKAAEVTLKKPI